jgi:hypothetical protein
MNVLAKYEVSYDHVLGILDHENKDSEERLVDAVWFSSWRFVNHPLAFARVAPFDCLSSSSSNDTNASTNDTYLSSILSATCIGDSSVLHDSTLLSGKFDCEQFVERLLPGVVKLDPWDHTPVNGTRWEHDVRREETHEAPYMELVRNHPGDDPDDNASVAGSLYGNGYNEDLFQPVVTKAGGRLYSLSLTTPDQDGNGVQTQHLKASYPMQFAVRVDIGRQALMYEWFDYVPETNEGFSLDQISPTELKQMERMIEKNSKRNRGGGHDWMTQMIGGRGGPVRLAKRDLSVSERIKHYGKDTLLPLWNFMKYRESVARRVRFPLKSISGARVLVYDYERPHASKIHPDYVDIYGRPAWQTQVGTLPNNDGDDGEVQRCATGLEATNQLEPLAMLVLELDNITNHSFAARYVKPAAKNKKKDRISVHDWSPNQSISSARRHYIVGDKSELVELAQFLIHKSDHMSELLLPTFTKSKLNAFDDGLYYTFRLPTENICCKMLAIIGKNKKKAYNFGKLFGDNDSESDEGVLDYSHYSDDDDDAEVLNTRIRKTLQAAKVVCMNKNVIGWIRNGLVAHSKRILTKPKYRKDTAESKALRKRRKERVQELYAAELDAVVEDETTLESNEKNADAANTAETKTETDQEDSIFARHAANSLNGSLSLVLPTSTSNVTPLSLREKVEEDSTHSRKKRRKTTAVPFHCIKDVHDFLKRCGFKKPKRKNPCFKAGLLNGNIVVPLHLVHAEDASEYLLTNVNCQDEIFPYTVKTLLHQEEGGDFEHSYVTGLCYGQPKRVNGKYHNHCDQCPDFGVCIGDYRNRHCRHCDEHYFSGLSGFRCQCQGGGTSTGWSDEEEDGAADLKEETHTSSSSSSPLVDIRTIPPSNNCWSGKVSGGRILADYVPMGGNPDVYETTRVALHATVKNLAQQYTNLTGNEYLYILCFGLGSISDKNCALPKLRAMEAMFLEKIGIANGSIVDDVREENSDDSVVAEDY